MQRTPIRLRFGFLLAGLVSLGAILALPGGDGATPPVRTLVAVAGSALALALAHLTLSSTAERARAVGDRCCATGEPALGPFVAAFAAAIGWMLHPLLRAPEGRDEQVAIGLGARMGNGLLAGVLVWLVLPGEAAPTEQRLFALVLVTAAFGGGSLALARRPSDVVLGYKG